MNTLLKKIYGVNDKEVLPLSLLIALGFFMGIFSATYSVAGTTLFLNYFNEKSDLPGAFIISGIIGLISAYAYSFLQKRIRFEKLIISFSVSIFLLVTLLITGFYFYPNTRDVVFLCFVLITPFVTHLSLIFWGIFGRIFDVGQSKKIIGNVDSGQLLASIIALFSIPVLLTILADVKSLIIISLVSALVFFFIILFITGKKLLIQSATASLQATIDKTRSIQRIFKNPYILIMGIFVMVSMVAVKFVDYSFLNVASAQFDDEKNMAFFLSIFEGAIVVLSFIFQTFFTDKVIENYGLKVSLLVTPVILFIFITLSSLIGLTLIDNFSSQSPTFLIFFIFIALSRMFSLALKDALDGPAFKLYFMPLEKSIRFDAQTKIDGIVTVFAGSVAGVFLFLFDRISWINFLHITFIIIPFVATWFYVVVKLYDKYQLTLIATLENIKKKGRKLFTRLFDATSSDVKYLHLKKDDEIIRALEITEKVNPLFYEKLVIRYRNHKSAVVREFLKKKLSLFEINHNEIRKIKSGDQKNKTRSLALEAVENAAHVDRIFLSKDQLVKLSRSGVISERILAANTLKHLISDDNIFVLIELLRDKDVDVKKVALKTAIEVNREETWHVLIEMLGSEKMANHAMAGIINIGDKILPVLENHFHKSASNPNVLSRIVRIYGELKSPDSFENLFKKIDYPNHVVKKESINALRNFNTGVEGYKRTLINTTLEKELGKTFWNQMALSELADIESTQELKKALESEIDQNFEVIFDLLGILYDQKSVVLVRENFENGTNESITFALELLNIFVDEELKPILFPVIDDLSPQEKFLKLCEEFPRESYDECQILQQLIFREGGQINNWTKVCALFAYGSLKKVEPDNTIKAQLFHEDKLIRHAALWVMKMKNPEAFQKILIRLKRSNKIAWANQLELEYQSIDDSHKMPLLMRKSLKLRSFNTFRKVSPEILSELVVNGDINAVNPGEKLTGQMFFDDKMLIILEGGIQVHIKDHPILVLKEGDIFSSVLNSSTINLTEIVNDTPGETRILMVDHQEVFKLATTYDTLMDAFALHSEINSNFKMVGSEA